MEPQTAISADDDTRTDMQVEETSLSLRHRLFPRAMAWNVAATLPTAEGGPANDTIKTARFAGSVPAPMLLRPTLEGVGLLPAKRQHTETPVRYVYRQPTPDQALPFGARPPTTDDRQRLFSTIGKWLDGNVPQEYASRLHSHVIHNSPQMSSPIMSTPTGLSPRVEMVRIDITPVHPSVSPIDMPTASKKRQRGPSGSTVPPNGVVARPASTSSGPKRCSVLNCGKIAVSKGLCRGHGGGRRCTFPGCTKCAQSRSPFCWAHGGGKRCEAPNCRRSRKTKRFCVDHVEMEHTVPLATDSDDSIAGSYPTSDTDSTTSTQVSGASIVHHLPSLSDALKRTISAAKATAMKNDRSTTLPQTREHLWPTC